MSVQEDAKLPLLSLREQVHEQELPHSDIERNVSLYSILSSAMTLLSSLYVYDLRLGSFLFRNFGQVPAINYLLELLSLSGDGILWFLIVLPIVTLMWLVGKLEDTSPATRMVFWTFYICNIVDILAIVVMKLVFKRARPPHHVMDARFVGADQHSFPSGHATRAWCLVGLFLSLSASNPAEIETFFHLSPSTVEWLFIVWAVAITLSRVALGRHYPSDVVAGACIGLLLEYPIAGLFIQALNVLPKE